MNVTKQTTPQELKDEIVRTAQRIHAIPEKDTNFGIVTHGCDAEGKEGSMGITTMLFGNAEEIAVAVFNVLDNILANEPRFLLALAKYTAEKVEETPRERFLNPVTH